MHSILLHSLVVVASSTSNNGAAAGATVTSTIGGLLGYVLFVAAVWPVFTKAGYPGWLALIPIVNAIFLVKVAGLSGWWTLLFLVPIANLVLAIVVALRIGRAFGHSGVFSFFLLFLFSLVGYFIVGYSSDTYDRGRI